MTPTNRRQQGSENCLRLLNSYYLRVRSWNKVSDRVNVPKRTLMRWRATGRISPVYQRIITRFIRENHPEKIPNLQSGNRRRGRTFSVPKKHTQPSQRVSSSEITPTK